MKFHNTVYLGKAQPSSSGSGSCVSFSDIIIKSVTIPVASSNESGKVRMYVGETNANYTHGYIYECLEDKVYSGSITFDPTKITVSNSDFATFINASKPHISDPESITHGTMTYHSGSDLWTWVGLDSSNNEVGRRQIYQSDYEDYGFVFTGTFSDEEVVSFTCEITADSSSYAWKRQDVQPSIDNLLNALYPVGSLYIGTQSTCPMSTLIADSTWELVSAGKALWTGDGTNGNTTIAAGLPNIKANLTIVDGAAASKKFAPGCTVTGAFVKNNVARDAVVTGSMGNFDDSFDLGIDASQSNSIYSDNVTTVQPPAYVVNVWCRTA